MSNYNKATNFAVKDTLTSGDPDKVVSGAEIDNEFNSIASAVTSKADKVASATTDNFAALDANGNLKDSGENPASVGSPSGTVANFAGQSAPTGWLLCDGSNVNRATYPSLFDVIGETFGAGDGSTTFGLPDLRGEFVRGWDNGRGVDSGRSFGSFQADEFRAHNHSYTRPEFSSVLDIGNQNAALTTGGDNTSTEGGDETRPRNVALNYIIKT